MIIAGNFYFMSQMLNFSPLHVPFGVQITPKYQVIFIAATESKG